MKLIMPSPPGPEGKVPGQLRVRPGVGAEGADRWREPITLLILLLASVFAVVVLFKPDFDPDIWSRLAVGKLVTETGTVTTDDPFSYTPKKPEWIDHEWGAGVVFYAVALVGHQKGLIAFKGLLLFGTILFIYLRCRRDLGRPPSLIFHLLLIGGFYLGFVATIRAQAFTYFFFSAWLYLLERENSGPTKAGWLIPVSAVLWANLHGGFLAGVALPFVYAAGAFLSHGRYRRLSVLAVLAALASLVNPYGVKYWSYLADAVSMSRSGITEWRALDLLDLHPAFLGFKILLALTVVFLVLRTAEDDLPEPSALLTLLVTAVVGLRVERHTTFFVIAAAPFVHSSLSARWLRFVGGQAAARRLSQAVPQLLPALAHGLGRGVLLTLLIGALSVAPARVRFLRQVPVRAVEFISQNRLSGNLLVPFNFGSYATWRLYPACRVSMDGRYETVYLDSTYEAVKDFFRSGPGWADFLVAQPPDIILVSPRSAAVEANLGSRPEWHLAFEDEVSRVYVRAETSRGFLAPKISPRSDPFDPSGMPAYPR